MRYIYYNNNNLYYGVENWVGKRIMSDKKIPRDYENY
jgi:hypothetical protein